MIDGSKAEIAFSARRGVTLASMSPDMQTMPRYLSELFRIYNIRLASVVKDNTP